MGVKDYPRQIYFSQSDLRKLEDLARDNGQFFEDYVAAMIHSKLMPLLEKQTDEARAEIEKWTDRDWDTFSIGGMMDDVNHSVEQTHGAYPGKWVSAHTTRFLPLVMSLRVLLSLSRERHQPYVPYDLFISKAYDVGLKFKHHLIGVEEGEDGFFERGFTDGLPWSAIELELPHRGSKSRKTNTPIADREKRGQENFHQYYTSVKPDSTYPGVLVLLGLVHLKSETSSSRRISDRSVALTKQGYDLAMLGDNPLLDGYQQGTPPNRINNSLSVGEQRMILKAIADHCPLEAERMTDILAILQNNDNATPNSRYWGLQRSYILEEIRDFEFKSFPDTGSPQTLNKELSAILSRMQDLGLISQGAEYVSGQRKKFSCTSEGEEWLENQK
jgi:hypothetical protein